MSPMQVQGTELFPVTTHLEWSKADLYDTFSNPFMSFVINDLMFIVLKTIIIWKNESNYPFSVFLPQLTCSGRNTMNSTYHANSTMSLCTHLTVPSE